MSTQEQGLLTSTSPTHNSLKSDYLFIPVGGFPTEIHVTLPVEKISFPAVAAAAVCFRRVPSPNCKFKAGEKERAQIQNSALA